MPLSWSATGFAATHAICSTILAGNFVTITEMERVKRNRLKTFRHTEHESAICSSSGPRHKDYRPGCAGITYKVIFGDSEFCRTVDIRRPRLDKKNPLGYKTTGFNGTGAQRSVANPLDNPAHLGYTATNGPRWVRYHSPLWNTCGRVLTDAV